MPILADMNPKATKLGASVHAMSPRSVAKDPVPDTMIAIQDDIRKPACRAVAPMTHNRVLDPIRSPI